MKQQPYFNNPRVKLSLYQGPPRNRAERRAMAKTKGRSVQQTSSQKFQLITQSHKTRPVKTKYKESSTTTLSDEELLEAEAQQIAQLKKSQTSLKREITRRDNLASKREAELQELYGEYSNAADVNASLGYAASVYGGYNDYANEILPLLKEMMRDLKGIDNYKPKQGDDNEYFKIDESYTGNRTELFKYITFKKIPDKYSMSIENIEELPWSSEENYQKRLDEIAEQIYKSNLNQMEDIPEIEVIDQLESLMNSSAAWHIASKWTEDSDQVQANWMALFDAGSLALRTDSSIFDNFRQMIRNEVDIAVILSEVDTLVYDALKE